MSYKLIGTDRDLLKSYAIHQDFQSIWAFVEALVDKQAGKPLPSDGLVLTPAETATIIALRALKAE